MCLGWRLLFKRLTAYLQIKVMKAALVLPGGGGGQTRLLQEVIWERGRPCRGFKGAWLNSCVSPPLPVSLPPAPRCGRKVLSPASARARGADRTHKPSHRPYSGQAGAAARRSAGVGGRYRVGTSSASRFRRRAAAR